MEYNIVVAKKSEPCFKACLLRRDMKIVDMIEGFVPLGETGDSSDKLIFYRRHITM